MKVVIDRVIGIPWRKQLQLSKAEQRIFAEASALASDIRERLPKDDVGDAIDQDTDNALAFIEHGCAELVAEPYISLEELR